MGRQTGTSGCVETALETVLQAKLCLRGVSCVLVFILLCAPCLFLTVNYFVVFFHKVALVKL